MCGIFAYLNHLKPKKKEEVVRMLIDGLKRQEYRGYDSAGIAIDGIDDSILLIRKSGRVIELENKVLNESPIDFDSIVDNHLGISHTRWATHGEPSERNSHPQSSNISNDFVVVHNGIITNFKDLKTLLETNGYNPRSDTDTEIIVLLMQYIYDQHKKNNSPLSFSELVEKTVGHLEGAFALVFKSRIFKNQCVATKRGSPLLIGIKSESTNNENFRIPYTISNDSLTSKHLDSSIHVPIEDYSSDLPVEYFIASDASAIIEYTNKVTFLEENDIAEIVNGTLMIRNISKSENLGSSREFRILDMKIRQIMKGNFRTFMEKEIYEQPHSIFNTMRGRIKFNDGLISLGGLRSHLNFIKRSRRLIFVACGTSYHSAVAVRQLMEELTELPVMVELASDFLDRCTPVFRDDVCIFISQSGETADTLSALRYCKKRDALLMGVTNVVGSSISRLTMFGVHVNAGPEIGVASTKAYTSQIVALVMIACQLAEDSISKKERILEIIEGLKNLPENIEKALKTDQQVTSIALSIASKKSLLMMGRGFQFATCLEGALKVKEVSYMHSEGILAGELKHGPLALVDQTLPMIMILNKDKTYDKCTSSLQQILARKGKPIILCDEKCEESLKPQPNNHQISDNHSSSTDVQNESVNSVIVVPHTVDCLQSIVNIIPIQLLALRLAELNDCDVDCPRNLAKSVTVE